MIAFLRKHRRALLLAGAAAAIAGCPLFPTVTPEDEGNASFVRQAVPVLHGRKIRGYDETKLLSDMIAATDRSTVLRALMAQPEFIDHWSEVLVDDLHVAREGFMSMGSCYGAPLRAGAPSDGLASTVLTQVPQTAAAGGAFNMSDVVRSALVLDNLYPLYRAHLYPLAGTSPSATDEFNRRDIRGAQFGEVYLNRQMGCLNCHNSEFSMSGDPPSGWKRTWPIRGLFEKSLFGSSTGEPTKNAYAMFRTDSSGGPLSPWGLQGCGTFKTTMPVDLQNAAAHFIQPQGTQFGVHQLQGILQSGYLDLKAHGLQRSLPAGVQATCTFCQANCQGNTLSIEQAANNAPNAAQVKAIFTGVCMGCHGGAAGLHFTNGNDWANDIIGVASSQKVGETLVIPGNANGSYLMKKLTNAPGIVGSRMPLGQSPLTAAQINQITAWINGLPALSACDQCTTVDCGQLPQELVGQQAFAYLVAARIVNNAWDEVFGQPVTIANYFPRHEEQRDVLWNLTEYKFVPRDWSLRDLLVRMMTSEMFNRVPPRTTAHATPYELPPVFDPWTVFDPRVPPVSSPGYDPAAHPENHKNAMSEESYRYSARSLVNSVSRSLDWPKPQRFPLPTYPSADLMRSIGMYFSDDQPGFRTVDFQGLLAWETAHGQCTKPPGVATDWIDRLVVGINNFDPATPGGPLTVEDVTITMRDWLLGYGALGAAAPQGLGQSERDMLKTFFGVASLADAPASVANLEGRLRKLCGMHLQSPQFQLSGIVDTGLGPKPRLRVCNTADCSYQQMCAVLKPAVDAQLGSGRVLICGQDTVGVIGPFKPPKPFETLCPHGICGLIGRLVNEGCPIFNPQRGNVTGAEALICKPAVPACDPRCSRIDCCGGPLPGDFKRGDMLLAWAEGAEVLVADGVRIQRSGQDLPEPLKAGTRVAVGDLVAIPPGSRFELRTREGKVLRTPEKGAPRTADEPVALMLITGESAMRARQAGVPPPQKPIPLERIARVRAAPWAARGEGGMLLDETRLTPFKYPENEVGREDLRRRGLLPEQLGRR